MQKYIPFVVVDSATNDWTLIFASNSHLAEAKAIACYSYVLPASYSYFPGVMDVVNRHTQIVEEMFT